MWAKIADFLRANFAVIVDAVTAVIALIIIIRLPPQSPELNRWVLVVLGLLAVSGVANRLGVFNNLDKNTAGMRDAIEALAKPRLEGSTLKTYKELSPIEDRLKGAHTIWLSGRCFSSLLGLHRELFRRKICDENCTMRILVIDPRGKVAQAERVSHNGDESLEQVIPKAETFQYRLEALKKAIGEANLRRLEVKVLDYSPRFDLMITNADYADGAVQVQLLTHWDDSGSRPIIRITKDDSRDGIWFYKFVGQFQSLWNIAAPFPEASQGN